LHLDPGLIFGAEIATAGIKERERAINKLLAKLRIVIIDYPYLLV
jgi:hypothetical protein